MLYNVVTAPKVAAMGGERAAVVNGVVSNDCRLNKIRNQP